MPALLRVHAPIKGYKNQLSLAMLVDILDDIHHIWEYWNFYILNLALLFCVGRHNPGLRRKPLKCFKTYLRSSCVGVRHARSRTPGWSSCFQTQYTLRSFAHSTLPRLFWLPELTQTLFPCLFVLSLSFVSGCSCSHQSKTPKQDSKCSNSKIIRYGEYPTKC